MICAEGLPLPTMEDRLQSAQCHDVLHSIRHTLRLKTWMIHFKNKNIRGQRDSSRSRSIIDGIHRRALLFTNKLQGSETGQITFDRARRLGDYTRQLENKDIRAYSDAERRRRKVQGEEEEPTKIAMNHHSPASVSHKKTDQFRQRGARAA